MPLLPVIRRKTLSGKVYSLSIHTGDKFGAGTDANVRVELMGENGASGEELMETSGDGRFEKNCVDECSLRCPDLGVLHSMRVSQDGKGMGSGWYLHKVVVAVAPTRVSAGKSYEFICDKWLDDGKGKARTVELTATAPPSDLE